MGRRRPLKTTATVRFKSHRLPPRQATHHGVCEDAFTVRDTGCAPPLAFPALAASRSASKAFMLPGKLCNKFRGRSPKEAWDPQGLSASANTFSSLGLCLRSNLSLAWMRKNDNCMKITINDI